MKIDKYNPFLFEQYYEKEKIKEKNEKDNAYIQNESRRFFDRIRSYADKAVSKSKTLQQMQHETSKAF